MPDKPHECWTVSATSYLRNLDSDDLEAEAFAVHYSAPPKHNENGTTTLSLIMPMLLVTGYAKQPQDVADRVAEILNAHWDSHGQPNPLEARISQLTAALEPFAAYQTTAERLSDPTPLPWSDMGVKDRIAMIAAHKDRRDAEVLAARAVLAGAQSVLPPQEVIDLVIAARKAWEEYGDSGDALDRALERFSGRVSYQNEPDRVPE